MYPTVPPAPDDPLPAPHPDYDVSIRKAQGRHRPRWGALKRLSIICKIIAVFSAVMCLVLALLSLAQANAPRFVNEYGYGIRESQFVPSLIMVVVYLAGAVFSVFFWLGMAELLLLFIEVERSTRQAAVRLSRSRGESPLEI